MFSQLLKILAASFIWKKYKSTILPAACLFLYLWLVGIIHEDYLSYREIDGGAGGLGLSFIIKWFAWIMGIAIFFFYDNFERNKVKNPSRKSEKKQSTASENLSKNPNEKPKTDPFAAIRDKKTLRSKADIAIDKKSIRNTPPD